jgi:hypothetical protein
MQQTVQLLLQEEYFQFPCKTVAEEPTSESRAIKRLRIGDPCPDRAARLSQWKKHRPERGMRLKGLFGKSANMSQQPSSSSARKGKRHFLTQLLLKSHG